MGPPVGPHGCRPGTGVVVPRTGPVGRSYTYRSSPRDTEVGAPGRRPVHEDTGGRGIPDEWYSSGGDSDLQTAEGPVGGPGRGDLGCPSGRVCGTGNWVYTWTLQVCIRCTFVFLGAHVPTHVCVWTHAGQVSVEVGVSGVSGGIRHRAPRRTGRVSTVWTRTSGTASSVWDVSRVDGTRVSRSE